MFMVREALHSLVNAIPLPEMLLVLADLGCSTGHNTFATFSEVMRTISNTCNELGRPVPEIKLLLNDLPGNDFNTLLGPVLSSYKEKMNELAIKDKSSPLYTAAVPGSFYDRLFPRKSVHFVHSCTSLHWLSQARIPTSEKRLLLRIRLSLTNLYSDHTSFRNSDAFLGLELL
jgi:SAM dependent carboxyl methyltransferase